MQTRIKQQTELAQTYAEDGAYFSAARILLNLSDEIFNHAQHVAQSRPAPGNPRNQHGPQRSGQPARFSQSTGLHPC